MHVVATAGHVDHGKSTLVRALTGMEPDRFAEEHRRGMTLDLGFVWTMLPAGDTVAFVDVPGHERFVATMLAGVGPVPAVMLVVAADQGWQAQSSEHLAILDALGVEHGLLVVTRADLADPAPVLADARRRLARTSLGQVEAVAVSATTGAGMDDLRAALGRLVAGLPEPETSGRVRLFVDRAFTIRGAGTVVTGTLGSGRVRVGDTLQIATAGATEERVTVRGVQRLGNPSEEVTAVARVALNLRGVPVSRVERGSVLSTPGAWITSDTVDGRLTDLDPADLPGDLLYHVGAAAVPCRVRPLGADTCRIQLERRLPLTFGDRAVLRDPSRRLASGVIVLDVEPPTFDRRGAARARAAELVARGGRPDPAAEVARRGAVSRDHLVALGVLGADEPAPASCRHVAGLLVDEDAWSGWRRALDAMVTARRASAPLEPGVGAEEARRALGLPTTALVAELVATSGGTLVEADGRITHPGVGPVFDPQVRRRLQEYVDRLQRDPFDAPTGDEWRAAGLTSQTLAAASRAGLVLTLPGDVVVAADAPQRAVAALAGLTQPFTMSEARQVLRTTRRVAVPLLEHLDKLRLTTRVDSTRRRVRDHE